MIIVKIFEVLSRLAKVNESIRKLKREHEILSEEMKEMDRRIICLEIYFEIIEKNSRANSPITYVKEIL